MAIEFLSMTSGQKTDYRSRIAALGDNDHPNPSHRNHSVTSGDKTIYEAEFTDSEISAANLKTLLAASLSINENTITVAIRETSQGIRITYTESATARIQIDVFGYSATGTGRPTKLQSNIQTLAYMAAAWGGGTLVAGVPAVDPDWTQDVDKWWETHPLNPAAYYPVDIVSPTTVIDVEGDYAGDLQAAINSVGSGGAKLILGGVYYNNVYNVIAKSNLHFIGQTGTSIKSLYIYPVGTYGLDYDTWNDAVINAANENHAAALAICADPPRNYYFKDITFDGNSEPMYNNGSEPTGVAILARGIRDILFDNCTFTNYSEENPATHNGPVIVHAHSNNHFMRNCTFDPPGLLAVYDDGIYGCGIINCTFSARFLNYALLFLTNNDFSYDYDGSGGALESDEMRKSCYVVVEDCEYTTTGGTSLLSVTGDHVLAQRNTVTGETTYPFDVSTFAATELTPYTNIDYQILNNSVTNCSYLVHLNAASGLQNVPPRTAGTLGDVTITGNTVTTPGGNYLGMAYEDGNILGPLVVSGNSP